MALQSQSDRRRPDNANDKLASNAERILWQAHCRAAELVDAEPGVVTRTIFATIHAEWRDAFLAVGVAT